MRDTGTTVASIHTTEEAMSQFDEYLSRIHDAEDKPLLEEAVKDANAAAHRSAYIMTWLSCAESIKRRFKVAALRDGAAAKIVGEYEQKERDAKSIDLFILDKAKDYGFVTGADHLRLKQIYEKRCLFGHPYETAPLETEVLDAMSVATTCLLSLPVRMRHGYLDAQATEVVTNKQFLDDYQPSVAMYAREIVLRAAPDLLCWWLAKIWKQANPLVGDPAMPWLLRRVCWVSDVILEQSDAGVVNSAFAKSLIDEPWIASLCLARSSAFQHLPTLTADQVVAHLLLQAETQPSSIMPLLQQEAQGRLTSRQVDRVQGFVDKANLPALLNAKVPLVRLLERVIGQLKSHNWDVQNPVAEALQNVEDGQFSSLTPESQEQLGRNLLQAGQKANECRAFISECAKGAKNLPLGMVYGMLAEMLYHDNGQMRPKLGCADSVIKVVGRLSQQDQDRIIDQVVDTLARGQHKEVMFSRFEEVSLGLAGPIARSGISAQNQAKLTVALKGAEESAVVEYEKLYGRRSDQE